MKIGSRLVIGAIAGFVGTMAMTATMRRLHQQLPPEQKYPLTPRELIDRAAAPSDEAARNLTLAAHFLYGAGCGALLAAADGRPSRTAGAAAGVGIWLGSYMGWIPAVGLLEPATRHPARRNALMIGAHIVWGSATAAALSELSDAHGTIFAAGPALDAPDRPRVNPPAD